MGFRFRRSVKLLPGVRLNFTTRGISATVGVRGASVNVGPSGTHLNLSLPGTGISYRTRLDTQQNGRRRRASEDVSNDHFPRLTPEADDELILNNPAAPAQPRRPSSREDGGGTLTEYRSKSADSLTSPGLTALSNLLAEIAAERTRVSSAIQARVAAMSGVRRRVERAGGTLSRIFVGKARRDAVIAAADACEQQLSDLNALLAGLAVDADFALSDRSRDGFEALTRAFDKMRASAKVWDVSASRAIDRSHKRASHAHEVARSSVNLDVANLPEVDSEFEALHFENANGADLYLYPYFLAIPRTGGGFSLMDLREIEASSEHRVFVENGEVPRDALIVGHSWEKSNKDGTPDKRFGQNRQIPNCFYSELQLRSQSGLMEVYQFSNADAASAFVSAFAEFLASLPKIGDGEEDDGALPPAHEIPKSNLPAQSEMPSLMSVGVFARALALAAVLIGAAALATPQGRIEGQAALSAAEEFTAAIWPQHASESNSAPSSADGTDAAGLVPVPPEVSVKAPSAVVTNSAVQTDQTAAVQPESSVATPAKPLVTVGKVSEATKADPASPASTAELPELNANQLFTLQTKLIALGYQEGEPERRMGTRILAAFNRWRQETGRKPVTSVGMGEYEAFMRAIDR